jgi:hypothetical protein
MVGALSGRALLCALAILAVSLTVATRAEALEAFDGRIQAHGFGEMQIRMLNSQFSEESDLSQWYNVFNLELEFDILPDGWGPFDLLQAYVRIEARYDCVIKRLCGTSRSVNTYGDRAKRLPKRLRDAEDNDWAGTINTNAFVTPSGTVARIEDERPSPLVVYRTLDNPTFNPGLPCPNTGTTGSCPDNRPSLLEVRDRQGFPGLDTLGNLAGADNEIGTNPDTGINDDPVNYLFEPLNFNTGNAGGQFLFTFREMQGPEGSTGRTRLMGPWLPKNFIQALGTLHTRANPFRGRVTPTGNNLQDILGQVGRDPGTRYHALDPVSTDPRLVPPPGFDPNDLDPVDPRLIAMAEYSANGVIGDGIFL